MSRKLPAIVRRILFVMHSKPDLGMRDQLSRAELDFVAALAKAEPLQWHDDAAHYLRQFGATYLAWPKAPHNDSTKENRDE